MSRARKFDHDEARRLREKGWTYQAIADRFHVSDSAVRIACDWRRRALARMRTAEIQSSGVCRVCGCQCSFNPYQQVRGQEICRQCSYDEQRTTVTDTTLKCHRCKEFKHDHEFPFGLCKKNEKRRDRHTYCRVCCTEQKREYRARLKARGIPIK